jgi:hypothetical protein
MSPCVENKKMRPRNVLEIPKRLRSSTVLVIQEQIL